MSGKEINKKVEEYHDKHDPGQKADAVDPRNNWADTAFQAQYLEKDDYDTIYDIKRQIAKGAGKDARTWEITDQEAKWRLEKVKQIELQNFHTFLQDHYKIDSNNPVLLKWAQEMFPEYWSAREKMIDTTADIQKRLAKMRLMGPRTRDDFTLLFGIASGRVEVPTGPLYAPADSKTKVKARGLFNPLRAVGAKAAVIPLRGNYGNAEYAGTAAAPAEDWLNLDFASKTYK